MNVSLLRSILSKYYAAGAIALLQLSISSLLSHNLSISEFGYFAFIQAILVFLLLFSDLGSGFSLVKKVSGTNDVINRIESYLGLRILLSSIVPVLIVIPLWAFGILSELSNPIICIFISLGIAKGLWAIGPTATSNS